MKKMLSFSVLLNAVLVVGLALALKNQRQKESLVLPVRSEVTPPAPMTTIAAVQPASDTEPAAFRWSQLMSAKDYRLYVANLRAIGCPEATIGDIVRGDTGRVFARERNQLALDESGTGPWSSQTENQLVADLLAPPESVAGSQNADHPDSVNSAASTAEASTPTSGAQSGAVGSPLFLQNVNWNALGFTADQQAAIAQVRQQYQSEMSAGAGPSPGGAANPNTAATSRSGTPANSGPGGASVPTQPQTALQDAVDQLQSLLGAQGYAAYEQQQYYAWYQPQVLANPEGGNLAINPEGFTSR